MIYTYILVTIEPQNTSAKTDRIEEVNELEIENSTIIAREVNTPF